MTYVRFDTADEGFPLPVRLATADAEPPLQVTHTVSNGGQYKGAIFFKASENTRITLAQNTYWIWNLDGF